MTRIEKSTCRVCAGYCPINVHIEDGRVLKVEGNPDAPIYGGFICPNGRGLAATHTKLDRLKHHLKRMPDGSFQKISKEQLIDEIAEKVQSIIDRHGPEAIAAYIGSSLYEHQSYAPLLMSFMAEIGSGSVYSPGTIDQPGLNIAHAIHGSWSGGFNRMDDIDVLVLMGTNPIMSKQYLPQSPGTTLKRLKRNGTKIIVIDPRRTESSRHAETFLQCIPGEDPTILAGLIHLIIENGDVNEEFVKLNASGYEQVAEAVMPFTPKYVAERAGISEESLRQLAKTLGQAGSANICLGTGPSMATRGTLAYYLGRCLHTLRGFWPGEGKEYFRPNAALPAQQPKAQPVAPTQGWGFGKTMRIRDLQETVAGMPTAALPEEILLPGEGQVRALFMHGGAMMAWPQTDLVKKAMESLELLIVPDIEHALSPTAKMATHVVATKIAFEVPVMSQMVDHVGEYHEGYGWEQPYAIYNKAIVEPPQDADLMEPWEIYFYVAQKLKLTLGISSDFVTTSGEDSSVKLDMEVKPSTDEIYELMCSDSSVPYSEIKKHPNGKVFEEARTFIGPRDETCTARFELAHPVMLDELKDISTEVYMDRRKTGKDFPYLLIPKRTHFSHNSFYRPPGVLKQNYNPACMHSTCLDELQIKPGQTVEIQSHFGKIISVIDIDNDLLPGVLSICHGFGKNPGEENYDPYQDGSNVNELLHLQDDYDPHTGMPRMGAVPVKITPYTQPADIQ